MMIKWLLFETRLGLFVLTMLESRFGLAVVQAEMLAEQRSGRPVTVPDKQ